MDNNICCIAQYILLTIIYWIVITPLVQPVDNQVLSRKGEYSDQLFTCLCLETGSHQDDEYAWAGVRDPKIMITTSHSPSSRLKQFAKVRWEEGRGGEEGGRSCRCGWGADD